MANNIIVGIGEILWDMLPSGKQIGGAPANFAYHASQFNAGVGIVISAVGNDSLGQEIIESLNNRNIKNSLSIIDFPTGTVKVSLDDKGIPSYDICQNVAWDNILLSDKTESIAKQCSAVCFGSLAQRNSISRNSIKRFIELVPSDALIIFDINLRQNYYDFSTIKDSLSMCNILKINDEEVSIITKLFGWDGLSDVDVCKRILNEYNLKMVIETKGENGSSVFSPLATSILGTPKVKVIDTVGAGDSFTGAFIAALLKGKSIPEAHKLAVEISAFVCTQQGAMPVIPDEYLI